MELSAEVSTAERHDAQGRHSEAVDSLLAGVRNDDPEARTRLGKRMIVGDRAPNRPREGVGLIVRAAEQGGAEALSLLSVLYALGMYLKPDWRKALNALRLSAAAGWGPAQSQLRALARDGDTALPADESAAYWLELARGVDFDYWTQAPAGDTLHEDPLIRRYPDFLHPRICRWLIDKARNRLSRAQVYDSLTREQAISHTRTNSAASFNIVETDLVNLLIQMKMAACTGLPFRQFEATTILHYAAGEQITEHYDFINPRSPDYARIIAEQGQRLVTFLVYLNDEYRDGETGFPRLGLSHRGALGEGLYFVNAFDDGSPDERTLHAGRPPRDGEKWIVSQFIRNRARL